MCAIKTTMVATYYQQGQRRRSNSADAGQRQSRDFCYVTTVVLVSSVAMTDDADIQLCHLGKMTRDASDNYGKCLGLAVAAVT